MKPNPTSKSEALPKEGVRYVFADAPESARTNLRAQTMEPARSSERGDVEAVVPTDDGLGALAVDQSGFTLSAGGKEDAESHHEARESARGNY